LLDGTITLGHCRRFGETLRSVTTCGDEWVALLSYSEAAPKYGVRDRWIGWDFRFQHDRLRFLANSRRFTILRDWHCPNLGSKTLSLCAPRAAGGRADCESNFGHPLAMLETLVDPKRFRGAVYRAASWIYVGNRRGFSRTRTGYDATPTSPKKVFVKVLDTDARAWLSRPVLAPHNQSGVPELIPTAGQNLATADAPLTQRKLTSHPGERRNANYYFTAKGRQSSLLAVIELLFRDRGTSAT
jgi:hypothetical protein